jgi:hypothetical protein
MTGNIVFFGHHKCGSRFFRFGLMAPLAKANGYEVISYKIVKPKFHFRLAHDLDLMNIDFESLKGRRALLVNLANAGRPVVDRILGLSDFPFKGIRVIRDPRQVFVSDYFHHRGDHGYEYADFVWEQLKDDLPFLRVLPEEAGLLHELDHISRDILENQLSSWEPQSNVLEIRLEDFDQNADQIMSKIMRFLGLTEPIQINGDAKGANPEARHWQEVFTPRIKDIFKARYGELLIRLGYETGFDW